MRAALARRTVVVREMPVPAWYDTGSNYKNSVDPRFSWVEGSRMGSLLQRFPLCAVEEVMEMELLEVHAGCSKLVFAIIRLECCCLRRPSWMIFSEWKFQYGNPGMKILIWKPPNGISRVKTLVLKFKSVEL